MDLASQFRVGLELQLLLVEVVIRFGLLEGRLPVSDPSTEPWGAAACAQPVRIVVAWLWAQARWLRKRVDVRAGAVADCGACCVAIAFFTGTGSGARDGAHDLDHHDAPESADPGRCCCQGTRTPRQDEETTVMSQQAMSPQATSKAVPDLAALRTEIDYLDAEIL